jgi:ATP-dependent exoDNAse (exonuclease V) beta subunit
MSAVRPSACVFAGAGTGKTHGLITECLRLLAGVDREEPLAPAGLCLLTFTEKAAAEMRGRLSARVDALAGGRGREQELEAAFTAQGRALPAPADWRRVQLRLSSATLSTFHAFCATLLRRAPPESGIPPGFELLDEEEALELLEDAAERLVLEALEANDPGVEALCTALDLRGFRRNGLVELLVDQLRRVRDHGHSPAGLVLTTPADVDRALEQSRERVWVVLEAATERAHAERADCLPLLASMADVLVGWGPRTALERAPRLAELRDALPRGGRNGLASALKALRDTLFGAASPLAAVALDLARPHEETWKRLLLSLEERQRAAFDETGTFDFAELLLRARTLLAGHPTFRAREQQRIGALLLDEFQDTNGVQLELVHLLAEARAGAPRPLGPEGPTALPLEPGFLWAVGDRKQSIYDFRGAEVEVFEQLAIAVEAQGGERRFLRESRRARPALVETLNGMLPGVLGTTAEHPWEVPFRAGEDDLVAWRAEEGPPRCVERLQAAVPPEARAEERRRAEADLLARRLRRLLLPGEGTLPTPFDRARPLRGGEVAILLRSFTELPLYTEALARHHVPHRVLRGRGFYASPEGATRRRSSGCWPSRGTPFTSRPASAGRWWASPMPRCSASRFPTAGSMRACSAAACLPTRCPARVSAWPAF